MLATVRAAAARAAASATGAAGGVRTRALNVGVIGAGRIGRTHLDTLSRVPGVTPVIVSDVFPAALEAAQADFGVQKTTEEANDVISDPEVEAVWICSPSQFHAEQIQRCAEAGKHIFCEKPIATDLEATKAAIKCVDDAGVFLMTAFQRRYDPHFSRLRQALAEGEVGEPVNAILLSRDPAPPPFDYVKGGGGLFKDMAIHDLDIARWLMTARDPDNAVETLYATGACFHEQEILTLKDSNPSEAIDTATITITFSSGSSAVINVCRKATYGYDQRVEVLGTDGTLRFGNVFPSNVDKWSANGTGTIDLPYHFFMDRYAAAYSGETVAFCEALKAGQRPNPDGNDGLTALAMALACDKSLREGRPVHLSEILN